MLITGISEGFVLDHIQAGMGLRVYKDLKLDVIDNGIGLNKEDCDKLFNRFSQGTKQKRSCSTGLGLYLSRQIIEAHGGKIYAKSEINKGSQFTFELKNSINDCKVIL